MANKRKTYDTALSVLLTPEDRAKLARIADARGVSAAAIIRMFIRESPEPPQQSTDGATAAPRQ